MNTFDSLGGEFTVSLCHVISNRSHIIFPKTHGSLSVIHATLSGWMTRQWCKSITMQHGWQNI